MEKLTNIDDALTSLISKILRNNKTVLKSTEVYEIKKRLWELGFKPTTTYIYNKCRELNIEVTETNEKEYTENPLKAYEQSLPPYYPYTLEEEIELGKRAQDGDMEARNILITNNLHFVIKIARNFAKYIVNSQTSNISILDLIQEGNLGLMEAVDKYDPSKNRRVVTYADSWITREIVNFIKRNNSSVTIPNTSDFYGLRNKILKAENTLMHSLGREPTCEEISELTGIPTGKVKYIQKAHHETKPLSLNRPVGPKSEEFGHFIPNTDNATNNPIESTFTNELAQAVKEAIDSLPHNKRYILVSRYELYGTKKKTYKEIGKELGFTDCNTSQLESSAIKRLRLKRAKQLKPFLEEL